MARKRTATNAQHGHKWSTFNQDPLSESRIDYIKRVYEQFYGLPKVSTSVIVRRSLALLANWLQHALENDLKDNEKSHVKNAAGSRRSPFGSELPEDLTDNEGKLLSYVELGNLEIEQKKELLAHMKGEY